MSMARGEDTIMNEDPESYCKIIQGKLHEKFQQTEIFKETNLFVCKHVEVDGLSVSGEDEKVFRIIRIRTDEGDIFLEGIMTVKEMNI
jgi:hypothetical protein